MTVPVFGRITPLQGDMLGLGGIICGRRTQHTDEERISEMRSSLESLRQRTGADFGFDLASWHNYLLKAKDHREEYCHRYAWNAVKEKILKLIDDPERIQLASTLSIMPTPPRD